MRGVILPNAFPIALPNLFNICIAIFKESPLVYAIGVVSIMTGAKLISSQSFRTLEAFTAAALIYIPLCMLAEIGLALLQKRLHRHERGVA